MQAIYLLDISGITDEEGLKALLPRSAVVKAEGYAGKPDRIRSLCGGWLIEKFTAKSPLLTGANGKPYKEIPPFFNVSHSGDKAGIFISDEGEVGFDIQLVKNFNLTLARRIFHEKGIKVSGILDFAKFWTMKEGAAKLTGEGIINLEKQVLEDVKDDSFTFCGEKIYYKTFSQGEYIITACARSKISAEITEITLSNI